MALHHPQQKRIGSVNGKAGIDPARELSHGAPGHGTPVAIDGSAIAADPLQLCL